MNGSDCGSQTHRSADKSSSMFNKNVRGVRPPRYTNEELDAAIFDDDYAPPSGISKEIHKPSTDEEEANALAHQIPSPNV